MDLHDLIEEARPDWVGDDDVDGVIKVVMHEGVPEGRKDEAARFARCGRTKTRREVIGSRFKDPDDPLRLVIVCDMWLAGFGAPFVHTVYLNKPFGGHDLIQAIARVNRVQGDKPGGLVVDFLGVADDLRAAVQQYSVAGGEGAPHRCVEDEAVP